MLTEYLPWSSQVLESAFATYEAGMFSIIDLDMGGGCNLNCIYCDTPDRKAVASWKLSEVKELLMERAIGWLFICGLGEPLHHSNQTRFRELITCCQTYDVRCSIFTNGLGIDEWFYRMVAEGVVSVLVKLDTLDKSLASQIYGKEISRQMIANIEKLAKLAVIKGHSSNVAASIVASHANIEEVPELVRFCVQHRMFPLIGELEDAGRAEGRVAEIGVSHKQLVKMRERVSEVLGEQYSIPICPAVVAGIHVDHNGAIIVDDFTGLSCHWFWLRTPKVHQLGHLDEKRCIEEYYQRIVAYRTVRLAEVEMSLSNIEEFPVGGCGGNARQLLEHYVAIQKRLSLMDRPCSNYSQL